MSELLLDQVHQNLENLKLQTIEAILEPTLERARSEHLSPLETIGYLALMEWKNRISGAISIRMRYAGFPLKKGMDQFDFPFQPSIDPAVIHDLTTLRFVQQAENIVFLDLPDAPKTHLAIGL